MYGLHRIMCLKHLMVDFLVVLALSVGCSADKYEVLPTAKQKYSLDEVRQRVGELQPGMSKLEVLAILGSPAVRKPNSWQYLPERSGYIVPAKALHIEFENNRVTGHRYVPIVLGEQFK